MSDRPSLRFRVWRTLQPVREGLYNVLIGRIAVLAVALAAVSLAAWAMRAAPVAVETTLEWQQRSAIRRYGAAAIPLFDELTRAEPGRSPLLTYVPSTAQLDLGLDCAAEAYNLADLPDERSRYLATRVCRTDVGSTIRAELALWNASNRVLAVRDDRRARSRVCADGSPRNAFYVQAGCFPSEWDVKLDDGGTFYKVDAQRQLPPAQDLFGFVARSAMLGAGDWLNVDVSGWANNRALLMSTEIERDARAGSDVVNIEVIGDIDRVEVNGQALFADETGAPTELPGRYYVGTVLCSKPEASPHSCGNPAAGSGEVQPPRVNRLAVLLPRQRNQIVVWARPLRTLPPEIAALAAARMDTAPTWETTEFAVEQHYLLTNHLFIDCLNSRVSVREEFADPATPRPGELRCRLGWRAVVNASREGTGTLEITAADAAAGARQPLTRIESSPDRSQIVANETTINTGLVPVVGIDQEDSLSLIGQLQPQVPASKTRTVDLSLDLGVQRTAFDTLAGLFGKGAALADVRAQLPQSRNRERRAAIVLVDAGVAGRQGGDADTGRILAAATFPQPGAGLSEWDIAALERFEPTGSPLAARGWSQGDRFMAPGSSFKPLVALAAVDAAARGRPELAALFGSGGGVDTAGMEQIFGTRYDFNPDSTTLEVPVGDDDAGAPLYVMKNHDGSTLCGSLGQAVEGRCAKAPRFTMQEALKRSANMWFGRLALLIDEDAVSCVEQAGVAEVSDTRPANCTGPSSEIKNGKRRNLVLRDVADRLFGGNDRDLMRHVAQDGLTTTVSGSRLRAEPILLSVDWAGMPRRRNLALHGIGQAVQASPLAMATIAGSIGAGAVLHPRLTESGGVETHETLLAPDNEISGPLDIGLADRLIEDIRDGMRAVVNEKDGTAFQAFRSAPDLAARTFGKTGTAEINEKDLNTVWFVGWVDGVGNGPWKDRRIGFACVITHAQRDTSSGGSICAPVMRELFKTLGRGDHAIGKEPS